MDSTFNSTTSVQNKKIAWLEHIMDVYGDALTKLAYSYVKDVGKAQEIVQDVFITTFNEYEKMHNQDFIKAWLYRVTINRSKDILRSSWIKHVFLSNVLPTYTKSKNSTEKAVLDSEQQQYLFAQVLILPIKYREILLLYYYEDLSIVEIRTLLNINENTIKTRLKRGRTMLEQRLKDGDFHA